DCTHCRASSELRSFFLYSISHNIASSPSVCPVPPASSPRGSVRGPARRNKLHDQKIDPITAKVRVLQRLRSDVPSPTLSSGTPTGSLWLARSSRRAG